MKKRAILRNVVLVLVVLIILTLTAGCKRPMTTSAREKRLKNLLKEKYGEEFEVRELYNTGSIEAWCYPVNDTALIFYTRTWTDMEQIVEDTYLQNIVAQQVDEDLQPYAEEAFNTCVLSTYIPVASTQGYQNPSAKTVTLDSLDKYLKSEKLADWIFIYIFVDTGGNEKNIDREYEFIRNLGNKINKGVYPPTTLKIYFGDADFVSNVQNALNEFGWKSFGSNKRVDVWHVIEAKECIRIKIDTVGKPVAYFLGEEGYELSINNSNFPHQ